MKIALALIIILLSGCTTYWSRPNTSSEQANADIYQCQRETAYAYPTAMTQSTVGNGYSTPSTTNCQMFGNQMNCTTMPGQYVAPTNITYDANAGARQNAFSNCMRAKGYTSSGQPNSQSERQPTKDYSLKGTNLQCFISCRSGSDTYEACRNKCAE